MGNSGSSYIESKLGNPFYASDSSKDNELSQLLSQFTLVSSYEDELFKRCSIIEHKQTKQYIVTKEINCANEKEMDKMYEEFQRRKATFVHINLLRLRYAVKKKTDGLFSDEFKIILFFDYVIASLQTQYINRKKKNAAFLAQEVNIIMSGAIKAYAALEKQKIPNSKVRLRNIYFGLQDGLTLPKVIDSKLFPDETNLAAVKNQSDVQDIFLAPEELKHTANQNYSNPKSGVFSLGMCMMQLCIQTPSREVYAYEKNSINYAEIQTRLNVIKNKYPLSVFYLIREMLQRNDDTRPSFTKLAENLPTNIKSLPATMNLSVMRNTQNYQSQTKVLPPSGYTKLISPIAISKVDRKMHATTLASEYRPNVDASEIYTNGNQYTGQKKENLRHGKGKYTYADGSYYYGDWFKGKMEGVGQLYDVNGNLEYEGEWKDDHFEGKGKLMSYGTDWTKYEGQFHSGKMEGFGEMFFKDGNRYKGEFRADYPWGKGRMFAKNGEIQAGLWEKGNFISQF